MADSSNLNQETIARKVAELQVAPTGRTKLRPEQRAAQRSLNGCINGPWTRMSKADGLVIWRPSDEIVDSYGGARFSQIVDHLDSLEIPYDVLLMRRGPTKTMSNTPGFAARISWDNLRFLEVWLPTRVGRLRIAVEQYHLEQQAKQPTDDSGVN
jgi:hypothetical protein